MVGKLFETIRVILAIFLIAWGTLVMYYFSVTLPSGLGVLIGGVLVLLGGLLIWKALKSTNKHESVP